MRASGGMMVGVCAGVGVYEVNEGEEVEDVTEKCKKNGEEKTEEKEEEVLFGEIYSLANSEKTEANASLKDDNDKGEERTVRGGIARGLDGEEVGEGEGVGEGVVEGEVEGMLPDGSTQRLWM